MTQHIKNKFYHRPRPSFDTVPNHRSCPQSRRQKHYLHTTRGRRDNLCSRTFSWHSPTPLHTLPTKTRLFFNRKGREKSDCDPYSAMPTKSKKPSGVGPHTVSLRACRDRASTGGRGRGQSVPTCAVHSVPVPHLLYPQPSKSSHAAAASILLQPWPRSKAQSRHPVPASQPAR